MTFGLSVRSCDVAVKYYCFLKETFFEQNNKKQVSLFLKTCKHFHVRAITIWEQRTCASFLQVLCGACCYLCFESLEVVDEITCSLFRSILHFPALVVSPTPQMIPLVLLKDDVLWQLGNQPARRSCAILTCGSNNFYFSLWQFLCFLVKHASVTVS